MDAQEKKRLRQAHQPRWSGYATWLLVTAIFGLCQILLARTLTKGPNWPVVPLTFLLAFLMHSQLMAFHEAAHRTLVPIRWWNDAVGIAIGTFSFTGLTAYRALHRTHHAYLATQRDEELWPFVVPGTPRSVRLLALAIQLILGIAFMPGICLRTFLRPGSPMRNRRERLRAWGEFSLMAVVWVGVIGATASTGAWRFLLAMYVGPAVLSGNIHGFRECIEHMGLTGSTVLSSTRSVVPTGPWGRLVAFGWFHIEYHGAHHRYGAVPQASLRHCTWLLAPTGHKELAPFTSYRTALYAMLPTLADPRIGAQWLSRNPDDCKGLAG